MLGAAEQRTVEAAWKGRVWACLSELEARANGTTVDVASCAQQIGELFATQERARSEMSRTNAISEACMTVATGEAIMEEVRGMRSEATEIVEGSKAETRQMETMVGTLRRNQEELHRDLPDVLREGL